MNKYKHIRDIGLWTYIGIFAVGRIISAAMGMPLSVAIVITVVQVLIGLIGCYYWMKFKSRTLWWTTVGILGPIGWWILSELENKSTTEGGNTTH